MPPTRVALGAGPRWSRTPPPRTPHGPRGPLPVPATDPTPRTGDPLLVNPEVSGPYGTADSGPLLGTALGFAPRPDSPLNGTGTVVPDNGGRDYRGAPLYRGRLDIGAVEGPPGGRA
ncbi:hypothetical protein [Streptomyces rhizosphaericus]|uniref:hypothetical protein n=1 Tax=Streptomyces rhizosphaericus TaxID=114699 RepID=UPI0019D04EE3|nr:hypothetical protein [Streptomyces rhizosphaericus]